MRTVGAPGILVGPYANSHTRGWPGIRGMPSQRNRMDWFPMSGGGAPSRLATAVQAPIHDTPAMSAAPHPARIVSQNRRATSTSRATHDLARRATDRAGPHLGLLPQGQLHRAEGDRGVGERDGERHDMAVSRAKEPRRMIGATGYGIERDVVEPGHVETT